MLHRRFAPFAVCVVLLRAGCGTAAAWEVTDAQRAELDAMTQADCQGLEPGDYHLDRLNALARTRGDQAGQRFSAALAASFERFARDLSQGRLAPSSDPQWNIESGFRDAGLPSPPALASAEEVRAYLDRLAPPDAQYGRLRKALNRYLDIAEQGGWPEVPAGDDLRAGARDERVVALRNRLRISGHYTAEMEADPLYFDRGLDDALRRFQSEQGLWTDGTLDSRTRGVLDVDVQHRIEQLKLTLERWRWLPRNLGKRYVWMNIASQDMSVMENGQVLLSMRTMVGRPYRQTPSLRGLLNLVTFNPTWSVPYKLAVEDILPQQRRHAQFLAQKQIRVFSLQDGREVDPAQIDWSKLTRRNFTYQLRQDAGPQNSLGHFKFSFDNPEDVYLHDTPTKLLFRLPTRTFSAGCVRIEDPLTFAQYLLGIDRQMSPADIDRAIDAGATRTVTLKSAVPIYLVYLSAWVDADAVLHFRDDVYGRDRILAKAWAAETARRAAEPGP